MPAPRKRRLNHNEIEKKRRDQQRHQLEVLRSVIPSLHNERPSALTIITTATDYVSRLSARVRELEDFVRQTGHQVPVAASPSLVESQQFIAVPAEPHTMPGEQLLTFLQAQGSSSPVKAGEAAATGPHGDPHAKKIRVLSPAVAQENFDPTQHTINPRTGSIRRRDSAMLLPTNDPNTFLFGKRDSLQNFFAGPLPTIFDDTPRAEFHCTKCHRGVENLIMIDCDHCHSWYHIRCVDIDPNHIPLQWRCKECIHKVGLSPANPISSISSSFGMALP